MYAWYFPKGFELISENLSGHRHLWRFAIVWLDDPAVDNPKILGVSVQSGTGYEKRTPPKSKYLDESSVKIDSYKSVWNIKAALRLTEKEGESQDLIMWDQLTDEAREALNSDVFNVELLMSTVPMPLKDSAFVKTLKKAWPFEEE
ncbi:Necrosis inducing protein NPP1 [Phytophthora megakarya]|uniref:Necrosis inducing protein NPP1 n=1 Tax=Phytophthora megakarya TaxID=4795 RepID=A0A225WKL7_9STRA|nr:Necrosis inducing protein NPP1 [Phytophthora megakarya]